MLCKVGVEYNFLCISFFSLWLCVKYFAGNVLQLTPDPSLEREGSLSTINIITFNYSNIYSFF